MTLMYKGLSGAMLRQTTSNLRLSGPELRMIEIEARKKVKHGFLTVSGLGLALMSDVVDD